MITHGEHIEKIHGHPPEIMDTRRALERSWTPITLGKKIMAKIMDTHNFF